MEALAFSSIHAKDGFLQAAALRFTLTAEQVYTGTNKELTFADLLRTEIRSWLNAPDPWSNHIAACEKRHVGTGTWFTEGVTYLTWLQNENSLLWITGAAGTGKTILTSAIVEDLLAQTKNTGADIVTAFYFDFSDTTKQEFGGLLKALLQQAASQSEDARNVLSDLYSSNGGRQVTNDSLRSALEQCIEYTSNFFLVVDAIDEAPRDTNRDEVLRLISHLHGLGSEQMHVLITSRNEADIHNTLPAAASVRIDLQNEEVSKDIELYVKERIAADASLTKWSHSHTVIEETLAGNASGM